jgi:hypothetical protein
LSIFKKNYNLFYTLTDSAFIEGDLDKSIIGKDFGTFKLEYEFKEVVFLESKMYAGITTDDKYIYKNY